MTNVFTKKEIIDKCQENVWLQYGGVDFEDDEAYEEDSPFSVYHCESVEEMKAKLAHGNWSIRSCFTFDRIALVNQVNGGDEWLAIYKHTDGRLESFESISFERIIERGDFETYFANLQQGPDAYWERSVAQ